MKRKILAIVTIGSILFMILTGCGVKEPVTVSADVNVIGGTQFIQVGEKLIEIAEDMEAQLEEHIEEVEKERQEEDYLSRYPTIWPSEEERHKMIDEKLPVEDNNILDDVTPEVTEEYNKRLKEKEEGIIYNPEEIFTKYGVLISDAEIIELVNEKYFELHNKLRAELGLPLFERDERLNEVATIRAEEISYFWSHRRPNGESVLEILSTLGMPSYGENNEVLGNYEPNALSKKDYEWLGEAGFEGLCNSPGHYANITEKHYTKIGIDSYVVHYDDGVIAVYTAFEFGS